MDPIIKKRLLAISGIRDFLEDKQDMYVDMVNDLSGLISPELHLRDPDRVVRLLISDLQSQLQLLDDRLVGLVFDLWRSNAKVLKEAFLIQNMGGFFTIVATYFVDIAISN